MKKKFLLGLPLVGMVVGCAGSYDENMIKDAAPAMKLGYNDKLNEEIGKSVNDFSNDFFDGFCKSDEGKDVSKNNICSGMSAYFALAMAVQCTDGDARREILNTLGIDYETLFNNISRLYDYCNFGDDFDDNSYEQVSNSIWMDKNVGFKQDCIDTLSNVFHTASFQENFKGDNKNANKRMSDYVGEKTHKLLEPKFNFTKETILVLLNTLYMHTLWNSNKAPLGVSGDKYTFTNADGTTTDTNLLMRGYVAGRILKEEKFSSFFVKGCSGARIKFIKPNDGYKLTDVMNKTTFKCINDADYPYVDENDVRYETFVYFPKYEAESSFSAKEILEEMGIKKIFNSNENTFTNITNEPSYCSDVLQGAKIKVDKYGFKAASYTAMAVDGGAMPPQDPVREEFILDRAFGFIVYNSNDLPVFSGTVNKI